jgi:flagella basal body P-ring formation protein FlgA
LSALRARTAVGWARAQRGARAGGAGALALAALLVAAQARAGGVVHVPAQVSVDAPVIALGDIAAFDGLSPELEAQLALIAFGPSGAVSGQQELAGARVRAAIHAIDPDIWVEVPERIEVRRAGVRIDRAQLQARVEQAIRHLMPWPQQAVSFSSWTLPEELSAPPGHSRLLVHLRPGEAFRERVTVQLELIDPDSGESGGARRSASVALAAELPVAVAARSLRRGERLGADAMRLEARPLRGLPREAALALEPLLGQQLAVGVREGTPLLFSQLDAEDVVRRGDSLLVSAGEGELELRLEARALEPGKLGQLIRARNPDSRRELRVRVTGPREGRLDSGVGSGAL